MRLGYARQALWPSLLSSRRVFGVTTRLLCAHDHPVSVSEGKINAKTEDKLPPGDHRAIGREQELFMFHEWSPGSAFFLPHGTHIYNTLLDYLRLQYKQRGYTEVRSPLLYHKQLWEVSGHWENYKENMYLVQKTVDSEAEIGLKPMNCPGHCLIFQSRVRSYRELPLRLADFSTLHRNEVSGSLTGLTRVRRFNQDDAHIFCAPDQVASEIKQCLDFVREVYGVLGFTFTLALSTRPEKYVGELSQWEHAESQLKTALQDFVGSSGQWSIKEGDGAFYGPKIDMSVNDSNGKQHQCATIQLDFNLPHRFNLLYTGEDKQRHTPVMIHRAIMGSMERMFAILTEHTKGKWPLWLSPRQVIVCPTSVASVPYASQVQKAFVDGGLLCDIKDGSESLSKQVRSSTKAGYNYMCVVGPAEAQNGTVTLRTRDGKVGGTVSLPVAINALRQEAASKARNTETTLLALAHASAKNTQA